MLPALLILSSCQPGGITFSPEQAAVAAVQSGIGKRESRPTNIKELQTVDMDKKIFVLLTFDKVEVGRLDRCIHVIAVRQARLGLWGAVSGGGGCAGRVGGTSEITEEPPIELGSGSSGSSSPTDPGYSYVSGLVHNENIRKARITWEDGITQEVNVVDSSLLAVRTGVANYTGIEGIDSNGNVIYNQDLPAAAPGKR